MIGFQKNKAQIMCFELPHARNLIINGSIVKHVKSENQHINLLVGTHHDF